MVENKIKMETKIIDGREYECTESNVNTAKILTNQDFLYRTVVDSIKSGVLKGDNIPSVVGARIEDCLDFIPNKELSELSIDGQIILWNGNHRVKAYDELGFPIETALIDKTELNYLMFRMACFNLHDINGIPVSKGIGELEKRTSRYDFYRGIA